MPPGAAERLHRHERARQCFIVLSGRARIEFESQILRFGAGQSLHVSPGLAHRFANDGEVDVEFLVVSAPSTAGDRIDLDPA